VQQDTKMLREEFLKELELSTSSAAVEHLRVKYLGRKGPIQDLMKSLKNVSPEEKRAFGKEVNDLKEEITSLLSEADERLRQQEIVAQLEREKIDVSLPGRRSFAGRKHPVSEALDEILDILVEMGFSVQYGPDIDTEYYNFGALNFPPDHPARDMQDTFYIAPNVLLRTHTSNVQARVMEQHRPPIRIVAPGNAYRNETITARSHVFFHQVEGLYIDKGVSFADLLATLEEFYRKLFHADVNLRYRPSYFPFVEPGMEVDISCLQCKGTGCSLCKYTGWLEVCGAGMVHPEVLKNGDIDPEVYSGYAWGMGVERTLLLKRGVNDIRLFSENDLRFLQQFNAL
jgi:phenylalanyl-tRNA synthetase alpha chain